MRNSDSTTTMRVKLVIMMRMEGARLRIVMSATICITRSVNMPPPVRSMESPLAGAAAAIATPGTSSAADATIKPSARLFILAAFDERRLFRPDQHQMLDARRGAR